jgi:uncharacterized protein
MCVPISARRGGPRVGHGRPLSVTAALLFLWLWPGPVPGARAQRAAPAVPAPTSLHRPAGAARGALAVPDTVQFSRQEVMIPMRDGVRLHTLIFTPEGMQGPLPIILERTPYGIEGAARSFDVYLKELAEDGYIFVFQDIRGRYGSEGTFVMQRPPHDPKDEKGIDEATDAWDTVDWLVKHVPNNNGRVGMLGISYPGWLTAMALTDPHPALRAASPQASPADMFIGDDFHHNGAFRLSYGFEYAAMMETSKENEQFSFDRYDTYEWYLRLGPLSNVDPEYLHGKIPTWEDFVTHPNYDAFWQRQAGAQYMRRVSVPTLSVAGWWDQEDFYGPITLYEALERHDTAGINYLVVGPWNHGGWSHADGSSLGAIQFGSNTSLYFRQHIQAPFFHHFLKGGDTWSEPEALTFETGSDAWRSWNAWPPRTGVQQRALYFRANHVLSFEAPRADTTAYDAYLSDPAHPVPYRHRPIEPTYYPQGSGWYTWEVEDQRFVDDRPDVLTLETPPLDHDVTIAGDVVAHLFAATTGSDADWIVKLIDVYPEHDAAEPKMGGYELMVAGEVLRGRFRDGFQRPEPVRPGDVVAYAVPLRTHDHTFLAGHRIMVQVQSTWFPIIDRNPQTYVPNIFQARASDFRAATQRIYRSASRPSHITLPVVTR